MDINPQTVKPISDDPELAKVLAGVNQQTDEPLQFDTPPAAAPSDQPTDAPANDQTTTPPPSDDTHHTEEPEIPAAESNPYESAPHPEPAPMTPSTEPTPAPAMSGSSDLTSIKKDALNDLRPLVGKLDIPAEEKFDTYLLLIRSTDDKTLIEPAYAAAQSIADESRKAQALLDVIKEIDYLSNPQQ